MDKKKNWRDALGGAVNKYGNISTDGSWGGVSAMKPAALEAENQSAPSEQKATDYAAMSKEYMDQYLKRKPFEFDVNADMLYQQYRKQAAESGRMAMEDTMARAAAMTGGYGNSYAMAAGQQAYQKQLDTADQMIPELYQLARSRYDAEGQDLLNKYSAAASMIPGATETTTKGMSVSDAMIMLGAMGLSQGTDAYNTALIQLVRGNEAVFPDFEAGGKLAPTKTIDKFSDLKLSDYELGDAGGWFAGKLDDNATVKAPDGKTYRIDQLYNILTDEGMSEDDALDFLIKLQNRLGIS